MIQYDVSVQDNGLVIMLYGESHFHCITHPDTRPYLTTTNHMKKNLTWGIHYTTIPDSRCLASQIEFDWYIHDYEKKNGSLNVSNSIVWHILSSFSKKMNLPKDCNCVSIEYSNLMNRNSNGEKTTESIIEMNELHNTPSKKKRKNDDDECHTIQKTQKTTSRRRLIPDTIEIDETYMFTRPFSKKMFVFGDR